MSRLEDDYNWLKEHDEFFDFDSVDEWVEFLNEEGLLEED